MPSCRAEPGAPAGRQVERQLPPTRFGPLRRDPSGHPAPSVYPPWPVKARGCQPAGGQPSRPRLGNPIHFLAEVFRAVGTSRAKIGRFCLPSPPIRAGFHGPKSALRARARIAAWPTAVRLGPENPRHVSESYLRVMGPATPGGPGRIPLDAGAPSGSPPDAGGRGPSDAADAAFC